MCSLLIFKRMQKFYSNFKFLLHCTDFKIKSCYYKFLCYDYVHIKNMLLSRNK